MPFIGVLEQTSVVSILERIEAYAKTGLLTIKRETQPVELYFRDGRLMCLGPVRTDVTLGERLLQDGVISAQALQEALLALGPAASSETRMALALMDMGHVRREELRAWVTQKTVDVLQMLLSWPSSEVYLEEDANSPSERLFVSLSITMLLSSFPPLRSASQDPAGEDVERVSQKQAVSTPVVPVTPSIPPKSASVFDAPTLFDSTQFFTEAPKLSTSSLPSNPDASSPASYISADALLLDVSGIGNIGNAENGEDRAFGGSSFTPSPAPTTFVTPSQVDTSFMLPDMVLIPADFSMLREMYVHLTPEQWRVLMLVDGQTSLQDICNKLGMQPLQFRRIAGELMALHVIQVLPPSYSLMPTPESSPFEPQFRQSGMSNPFAAPNYTHTSSPMHGGMLLGHSDIPQYSPVLSDETQSQWGNGGNGAKFVRGKGWVTGPQPMLPLQTGGSFATSGSDSFAAIGGGR